VSLPPPVSIRKEKFGKLVEKGIPYSKCKDVKLMRMRKEGEVPILNEGRDRRRKPKRSEVSVPLSQAGV
jgi:hypothetical protein